VSPFIPVIGTTSDESAKALAGFNDAGGDELVIKPLSATKMGDCIELLLENTRSYLVTRTYVGSDHQGAFDDRSGYSEPVKVPNSLGLKLNGKYDEDRYKAALSVTSAQVTRYRAESLSQEIAELTNELLQRLQGHGMDSDAVDLIDRITTLSSTTRQRVLGTPYVHVSGVCEALNKTLANIRPASKDIFEKDVKLIVPLTQSIRLAFSADEKAEAMAKAILNALGITDKPSPATGEAIEVDVVKGKTELVSSK
jgi:hypothetical protein